MNVEVLVVIGGLVALLLLAFLVLWVIGLNKLVQLSGQVNLTVGTLAAQYQQRLDLIPVTVKLAREAVTCQIEYFEKILTVRKEMHIGPATTSLGSLPPDDLPIVLAALAAARSKPSHESNPAVDVSAFDKVILTVTKTEEDISGARRFFWSAVTDYNIAVRSLPLSIIARFHKYAPMPEACITTAMATAPSI